MLINKITFCRFDSTIVRRFKESFWFEPDELELPFESVCIVFDTIHSGPSVEQ